MKFRFLTLALLTTAAAASAAEKTAAAKPDTENKTMTSQEWKGQYGGPLEPGHMVAADVTSWKALAAKVGLDASAPDFTKSVAVAVFVGERMRGGFTAAFEESVMRGDDLLVRYRIKIPSGFTTQALAQPWKVKVFARPKGKVIVEAIAP
ncbi:MAG TPA: hypothetical protein DCZ01_01935 [Elusimicrobia bacterium]|nr:hypothetical protein [Elusimicrobiota bacterium]